MSGRGGYLPRIVRRLTDNEFLEKFPKKSTFAYILDIRIAEVFARNKLCIELSHPY